MTDPTPTNPLGMKSLTESMNVSLGATIGDYFKRVFTWDWIFSEWYEKLILVAMTFWSGYAIWRVFFS